MTRAFAFGIVALVWSLPAPAEACFCGKGPCGAIATAPVLFEATVVALEPDPAAGSGTRIARLADVRAIRGRAPQVIELEGSSCDLEFAVGGRYFIEPHEWAPGKFGVSKCSLTRPADRAAGFHAFLGAASPEQRPRLWGSLTTLTVGHRDYQFRGGGPAIAGAVVLLSGPVQRTTTSSASGDFMFAGLPDGEYLLQAELPAARADVASPDAQSIRLIAGQVCMDVDVVAASTARVTGALVDARGAPVADAQVDLYTPPYNPFRRDFAQRSVVSDASGRFEFTAVPPGVYHAGVGVPRPGEYRPFVPALAATGRGREIHVEPGAAVTLAPLVARRVEPVTVHGLVSGPAGVPLNGFDIVIAALDAGDTGGWRVATTDEAGRFTVTLYGGVRYRIRAVGRDQRSDAVELVAGESPIALRLQP